jgi:hypothetical protein
MRATVVALLVALGPPRARAVDVPMASAGLGPCTADFVVTDSSNKPLYNAKVHVALVHGFLNKRKQDLEVGTNSDGKARFEGLPDKLKKKPLEFQVRFGAQTKSVTQDPETNCHASFNVVLATP